MNAKCAKGFLEAECAKFPRENARSLRTLPLDSGSRSSRTSRHFIPTEKQHSARPRQIMVCCKTDPPRAVCMCVSRCGMRVVVSTKSFYPLMPVITATTRKLCVRWCYVPPSFQISYGLCRMGVGYANASQEMSDLLFQQRFSTFRMAFDSCLGSVEGDLEGRDFTKFMELPLKRMCVSSLPKYPVSTVFCLWFLCQRFVWVEGVVVVVVRKRSRPTNSQNVSSSTNRVTTF